MTKTSYFCSIHQERKRKSCLKLNLIIFPDFHSFTVNEDKLQNKSIFKISAQFSVCYLGQNLKMTKTFSICFIHQLNMRKSCLQMNLIILTDFHSFAVNEDKLQN